MIQRCPHCHRDVIFSRDICPACGFTAAEEDRLEATALELDRRGGSVPTYTGGLEEAMNATQRHGRTLLGLLIFMIVLPEIVYSVVRVYWLSVDVLGLVRLLALALVLKHLWDGFPWARPVTLTWAGLAGVAGPAVCVAMMMERQQFSPVLFLAIAVFGPVYLTCAVMLWRSHDIPEFLKVQRRRRGVDGGLPTDR